MPLFNTGFHKPYSEYDMQIEVAEFLKNKKFIDTNYDPVFPNVLREFRIPEIGRISDIIVYMSKRKIFNIECKLDDVSGVLKQAKDHLIWANYSIICLPFNTYVPPHYQKVMIEHGIGLILYIPGHGLVEAINCQYNNGLKNSRMNHDIRKKVVNRLIDHISPPQKKIF